MIREDFGTPVNISSATTTVVKAGPGILVAIVVNKAVANSTYTIYDGITTSGVKIATVTNPASLTAVQYTLPYMAKFTEGLTIVTSAADDINVIYA